MKLSVLCAGMAEPHAGWAAIDELAELLVHYFDAELLSPKPWPSGWSSRWLERIRPRYQPVDTAGGDVLMVVCRGPADLALIRSVPDFRHRFQRIHAWVTDSYFQAGFGRETALHKIGTLAGEGNVRLTFDRRELVERSHVGSAAD